jgi:hypothetical protein
MPESSAIAGRPVISQACLALMSAFSTKVSPVSSASSTPSACCEISSTPRVDNMLCSSRSLPLLPLARTIFLSFNNLSLVLCVSVNAIVSYAQYDKWQFRLTGWVKAASTDFPHASNLQPFVLVFVCFFLRRVRRSHARCKNGC